ncbi:hypothetical protein [Enterobacter bugandensis]|uniref:hypothetical protein n=1 Tax=Enterobacter bugandensis TaxID=881260 RepID=UPI003D6EEF2C
MSDIVIPEMITRSLDLLPDPYCIQTHDGLFLYANLSAAKLAGMPGVSQHRKQKLPSVWRY